MRKIKYLLLGASAIFTGSLFYEYIYRMTCFYSCDGDKLPSLIILGFLLLLTTQAFLGLSTSHFLFFLITLFFIDVVSYLFLPDYTDYIVPEKKLSLLFFNILIPFVFLVYSLVKKNKGISIGKTK